MNNTTHTYSKVDCNEKKKIHIQNLSIYVTYSYSYN